MLAPKIDSDGQPNLAVKEADREYILLLANSSEQICAALEGMAAVDALEKDGLLDVKSPMEYEDLDNALSRFRSATRVGP